MPELTHSQILAIVDAGSAVVWRGRIIHRADDVPSDADIATADDVAAQDPFRGPAGLLWQGVWSSEELYHAQDAVSHDGSAWIALRANADAEPDLSGSDWGLLAQAGATGAQGPAGTSALTTHNTGVNYTIPAGGYAVLVEQASLTITLPSAASNPGALVAIANNGAASSTTVQAGSQHIDDQTSTTLAANHDALVCCAIGGTWITVARYVAA